MLQEFRVDNFKSLINITFKPQATNLLLGMNNSGKTSLCQALRFLSMSSSLSLDLCAEGCGGRFGLKSFMLDKSTIDFFVRAAVRYGDEDLVFEYELTVSPPGNKYDGEASVRLDREVLSVGFATRETPRARHVTSRRRRRPTPRCCSACTMRTRAHGRTCSGDTCPDGRTMISRRR